MRSSRLLVEQADIIRDGNTDMDGNFVSTKAERMFRRCVRACCELMAMTRRTP